MSKFSEGGGAILWDSVDLALGTLAQQTVVAAASNVIDTGAAQGFRVLKTEYLLLVEGLAAGEGPVIYGMAGPGMTALQIQETIVSRPSGPLDRPTMDRSMRPVWILGQTLIISGSFLHQQKMESENIRWSFPENRDLKYWAINNSNAAALTTGASLTGILKHYGVWLGD